MRLALFPLAVVLLPGTPMPLHIFEPRYRRMLADALAGPREFGLVYLPPGVREGELASGWPLCLAHVDEHEPLEDGRSNIVVRGTRRLALDHFVDDEAPYPVGLVRELPDATVLAEALVPRAAQARALFGRVAAAARTLADDTAPPPALPDDDTLLAYAIAAAVDLDLAAKHRLLATRDAAERLSQVVALLTPVATDIERRAAVHGRARTNGHGPH